MRINQSRARGDYHEYMTIRYLCKSTGARELNDDNALITSKILSEEVKNAVEIAAQQCSDIIQRILNNEYEGITYLEVQAIGRTSGTRTISDVTDIIIRCTNAKQEQIEKRFSIKFTEAEDEIFTKNMGAKSLLSEYFRSNSLQQELNQYHEIIGKEFFEGILQLAAQDIRTTTLSEAKNAVKKLPAEYQRFNTGSPTDSNLKNLRDNYMERLRDKLYDLLVQIPDELVVNGCRIIMGLDSNVHYVLISKWRNKNISTNVDDLSPAANKFTIIKSARNSVVVDFGNVAARIRFKHEGGKVWSSIKLAGSKITK